ncbi:TnsA endonuclease N-terminal domain-containing protein [Chryseobacterium oranimense]|uniref:TnsA endonuclease N-terminal domain-containing protein n=1 Tax=Chryseobacterium oranimense TaxID=421058 RepID=UPI0021B053BB|nr:TnsA endonuclease N-terminal domain-containing protein [Chryseobacterium oranimense]UWX59756.1 TnsA endonuclease N-terminal domain-containing protein [Chryseobacterium oranimense]
MKLQAETTKEDEKKSQHIINLRQNTTKEDANFVKRVREINAKNFSLSGIINIDQLKNPIQFESSLERDYIFLLEHDQNVKHYLEQPLKIKYFDHNKKQRTYIPDFIVEYFDDRPTELIEIKYTSTLIAKKDELEQKFKAAREYCQRHNLIFKITDEINIRELRETELYNYKFLHRYKNYFHNINKDKTAFPILNENLVLLRIKLKELKKCTVSELVTQSARDSDKQAELIFLIWYMVSNNFIKTDLTKKLTLNSIICLG